MMMLMMNGFREMLTKLGKKLSDIRGRAIAKGMSLMSEDEILEKRSERLKGGEMKSIAELIHDAERAKDKLEDDLVKMGLSFEDTVYDWYDNSMELIDVPDEQRLSMKAQALLLEAGFSKVYLNHIDKWETHYTLKSGEEVKGWRVSYPQKRGDGNPSIWVEEKIDSWPNWWFETGYAEVKC